MEGINELGIIAGPCALESREQLREAIRILRSSGINHIRASVWKPRTEPGWDGTGSVGLQILLEETLSLGMVPATEILTKEHAKEVVQALAPYGPQVQMIVWLGSRNQNHMEQQEIAKILAAADAKITLMVKNQMWDDERHWVGIIKHVLAAGFPKERLVVCHRGFCPGKMPNPKGLRNLPDFEMMMRVRNEMGVPMVIDPSHIGGSQENVIHIIMESLKYDIDGYIIEVHHNPAEALCDANQQLNEHQLLEVLEVMEQLRLCNIKRCA